MSNGNPGGRLILPLVLVEGRVGRSLGWGDWGLGLWPVAGLDCTCLGMPFPFYLPLLYQVRGLGQASRLLYYYCCYFKQ